MQILTKSDLSMLLFSVLHLGDVETRFYTLTFSLYVFMVSSSAWAERSPGLGGSGGLCLPGRHVGVGGCVETGGEAGQDLRAQLA